MAISSREMEISRNIAKILDNDFPKIQKKDLAKQLGIPNTNFSDMLNGKRRFHVDTIYSLSEILKVSADYLLGRSDVSSIDADMQAAVKVLGLSQKAVENISLLTSMAHSKYYTPAIEQFFSSDICLSFFNAMEDVAFEAFALREEVESNPYLGNWREESHRGDKLKLAIYEAMQTAKEGFSKLYDTDKIIERSKSAYLRDLISGANQTDEVSDHGQETS